jgi:thioester reductase-like protein
LALDGGTMLEDDALNGCDGLLDGYSQSKWVAEKVVMLARSRGIPVAIYRPGGITAHSETGVGNTDDLMSRLLKGCLQLGSVPRMNMLIDMTPVDFVARAVVHLSMREESVGKAFHLFNPSPLSLTETIEWLRSVGYAVRSIPFTEWREEVRQRVPRQPEHALYPLLPLFAGELTEEQSLLLEETVEHPLMFRWDCRNTIDGLTGSEIRCPRADTQLLSTYLARFIDRGFLDPV